MGGAGKRHLSERKRKNPSTPATALPPAIKPGSQQSPRPSRASRRREKLGDLGSRSSFCLCAAPGPSAQGEGVGRGRVAMEGLRRPLDVCAVAGTPASALGSCPRAPRPPHASAALCVGAQGVGIARGGRRTGLWALGPRFLSFHLGRPFDPPFPVFFGDLELRLWGS